MMYRTAWALRAVAKMLAEWADALDPPKALLFGSLLRPFDYTKPIPRTLYPASIPVSHINWGEGIIPRNTFTVYCARCQARITTCAGDPPKTCRCGARLFV